MYFSFLKKIEAGVPRFEAEEITFALQSRHELFDHMLPAYAQLLNDHPEHFDALNKSASFLYAHSLLGLKHPYAEQTRFPAFFDALNDDNKRRFAMSHPLAKIAALGGDKEFLNTLRDLFPPAQQRAFIEHCHSRSDFKVRGEIFDKDSTQSFRLATLMAFDHTQGAASPNYRPLIADIPPEMVHGIIDEKLGDNHKSDTLADKLAMFAFSYGNAPALEMMCKSMKRNASFKPLFTPSTFSPQWNFGYPGMFEVAQQFLSEEELVSVLTQHGGFIGICNMGNPELMERAWKHIPESDVKYALFGRSKWDGQLMLHGNQPTTEFIMDHISPEKRMEILRSGVEGEDFELVRMFVKNDEDYFLTHMNQLLTDAQASEIVAHVPRAIKYFKRHGMVEPEISPEDAQKAAELAAERAEIEAESKKGIERWQAMQGMDPPDYGLKQLYPLAFSPVRYKALLPLCQLACEMENNQGAELNAFKLSVLFRYLGGAEKYLDAYCKAAPDTKQLMHDACMFNITANGNWTPKLWAKFLIRFPVEGRPFVGLADRIEKLLAEDGQPFPETLKEMHNVALRVRYKRIHENREFGELANSVQVEEKHFNKCLDLIAKPLKTADKLPDITINGDDIGHPGYYMRRLAPNDPKSLIIGHMLGNCQSVGRAGEEFALHSATSPYGAVYVWCKREGERNAPADPVIAESWVWISKNNALVFDSFERKDPKDNVLAQPFIEHFAHEAKRYGFNQVRLGVGGDTPKLELPKASEPERWIDFAYSDGMDAQYDSKEQYSVIARNHIKTLIRAASSR